MMVKYFLNYFTELKMPPWQLFLVAGSGITIIRLALFLILKKDNNTDENPDTETGNTD